MGIVAKFILIVSAITVAAVAGNVARRVGWVKESHAGPLMFKNVVFGWTPASMFVLWQLPLQWDLLCLPLICAALPIALAPAGYLLARSNRLDRIDSGTFLCSVGTSNIGLTMGGFVCYCLFGMVGLGYAQLYCCSWSLPYVCFYYPLARKFGEPGATVGVRFILRTLFDRRSLPVLGALTGLTLNLLGATVPVWLKASHVIDVLIVASVLLSFFVVGLQLHFAGLGKHKFLHINLAMVKFCLAPLIVLVLLGVARYFLPSLPQMAQQVVMVQSFMPAAIFSVVIANLFGLNARLASTLFLVNTVLFLVIILPVLVYTYYGA